MAMRENRGYGDRVWFGVSAKAGVPAEVFIYDEIGAGFFGGGVAPEAFISEVNKLGLVASDTLTVRINSPGGNYFDGNAIYNYLRTVKAKLRVVIDGMAASAASLIAMAGDRIEMPANAMMFIHNPWTMASGDASEMRKTADDLDQMKVGAVATYLRRTGDKLSKSELITMLDSETWLTADDAVKYGLADAVVDPVRAAALLKFDINAYGFKQPNKKQQNSSARQYLTSLDKRLP
jgi:ATP-dependent Clp protease protease subunit